jgi:predicted enzyme related to lactoylglutathione lyase
MGAPVVHFEILTAGDGSQLKDFYAKAFDWNIDSSNPMNYGVVNTGSDRGIQGGVSGTDQGGNTVIFYIGVDELEPALKKIEELGGKTVMEPMEIPNMVTFAQFQDPAGNVLGLVKSVPDQS